MLLDLWMDLRYTGNIVVTPPAIIETSCKLHIGDFPFDKKVCELKFARYCFYFVEIKGFQKI